MFGNYISPALVDQMVKTGEVPKTGVTEAEVSAFFANMASYVAIAERLPLTQLREVMDTYFGACSYEIDAQGGMIDKFIGDSVVAMFGAPLRTSDHALRAGVAALHVQKRIAQLREKFRTEDTWPEPAKALRVRIGIHTGSVLLGNLGTAMRFNYTMMGDNVNLAARMESGAKSYGVWTMCTEATKGECDRAHAGRILFRSLGRIVVKGRTHPIELFEPVALKEDATDQLRECVSVFEAGLARWRERDWDGAINLFGKSARLECDQPGASFGIQRNPSTVFLEMAQSFRANPGTGPLVI
jgi:adenylate cyclase